MNKIFFLWLIPVISLGQTGRLFTTQLAINDLLIQLDISTNIPNHVYQKAGITLPDNYTFANNSCPSQNGSTCTFLVSSKSPVRLYINGPKESFIGTLCLNQPYQLNCENLNVIIKTNVLEMGFNNNSSQQGLIYLGDNNSSWTLYPPNNFTNYQFKGSYCSNDGSYCIAAGFSGTGNNNYVPAAFTMTNNNQTWTPANTTASTTGFTQQIQFWAITCLEGQHFCVASGNGYPPSGPRIIGLAWYSYDDGQTWSQPQTLPTPTGGSYPPFQVNAVSCYTSSVYGSQCVLAGFADNNNGLIEKGLVVAGQPINFTATYPFTGSAQNPDFVNVTGVHCSNEGNCVVSANLSNSTNLSSTLYPEYSAIFYSTDGGSTWNQSIITTLAPNDAVTSNVSSISCDQTGRHCVAAGWYSPSLSNAPAQGLVYVSDDGGVTWPRTIVFPNPRISSNVNRFNVIRCSATNSTCYVAGHGGNNADGTEFPISYISYDYGNTWSEVSFLPLISGQQTNPSSDIFTLSLFNSPA